MDVGIFWGWVGVTAFIIASLFQHMQYDKINNIFTTIPLYNVNDYIVAAGKLIFKNIYF